MSPDSTKPAAAIAAPPPRRGRKSIGIDAADFTTGIDMRKLRAYRLARTREQLKRRDYMGAVLYDPINIRYATGSRNMQVWTLHNPVRYCFVPAEGPVVLFDFHNCEHLSGGLETIAEVRPACSWDFFGAGAMIEERAKRWADEVADLVKTHGRGNKRLAIDRCDPAGVAALAGNGIQVFDGQEPLQMARAIKSTEEIACMNQAISVCEAGMAKMREMLRPGMTENELWSHLHQVNIALGGEWIETRLLSSGGRTNPWFQESSDRIIRAGELVSFDTDLIGPFGYCADLSRSYFCGPGRPTPAQQHLYGLAYEQIHANMALMKPGMSLREFAEKSWKLPDNCAANRYSVVFHGVGLADEYPGCVYAQDFERGGYDGIVETGMTLCFESYIGEEGGEEGVKLEQQVLVTDKGVELLSTFPFEAELLPSRWL